MMERLAKQSEENNSNRKMQFINLFLYGLLVTVQAFYLIQWSGDVDNLLADVFLVRVVVELVIKIIVLGLVIHFSMELVVRSHEMGNGDLLIVGTTPDQQVQFQFIIRSPHQELTKAMRRNSSVVSAEDGGFNDYD